MQIGVPSLSDVPGYAEIAAEIDDLVAKVNEEFGDGGLVRASPELAPEAIRHVEGGTSLAYPCGAAGYDAFVTRTQDRIVLVPALGNGLVAQNLDDTSVLGHELRARCEGGLGGAQLAVTRLFPENRSGGTRRLRTA